MPSMTALDRVALGDVLRGGAAADAAAGARRPAAPRRPRSSTSVTRSAIAAPAGVLGGGERRRPADLHLDVADRHVHDVLDRAQRTAGRRVGLGVEEHRDDLGERRGLGQDRAGGLHVAGRLVAERGLGARGRRSPRAPPEPSTRAASSGSAPAGGGAQHQLVGDGLDARGRSGGRGCSRRPPRSCCASTASAPGRSGRVVRTRQSTASPQGWERAGAAGAGARLRHATSPPSPADVARPGPPCFRGATSTRRSFPPYDADPSLLHAVRRRPVARSRRTTHEARRPVANVRRVDALRRQVATGRRLRGVTSRRVDQWP